MSINSHRTLFACTWCGAEQILLDLDPQAVADAAEAWHAAHDDHDPNHGTTAACEECGTVSPVQSVDSRTVIGLTTFNHQAHADWLAEHDCTTPQATLDAEPLTALPGHLNSTYRFGGNIARIKGMPPRPSWSDPKYDVANASISATSYRSTPDVITYLMGPAIDSDKSTISYSTSWVTASRFPTRRAVCLELTPSRGGHVQIAATPAEARRLAEQIRAAADLAETD